MKKLTILVFCAILTCITCVAGQTPPFDIMSLDGTQTVEKKTTVQMTGVENFDETSILPQIKANETQSPKYVGTVSFDDSFVRSVKKTIDYDIADKYDVYKTQNGDHLFYTIKGLFDSDIYIINDPGYPRSWISTQTTGVNVLPIEGYDDLYDKYKINTSYCEASPCMQRLNFDRLQLIFNDTRCYAFYYVNLYFDLIEGEGFKCTFDDQIYNDVHFPNIKVHFNYSTGASKAEIKIGRYNYRGKNNNIFIDGVYSQTHDLYDNADNRFDYDMSSEKETGVYYITVRLLNEKGHYISLPYSKYCYVIGEPDNGHTWQSMGQGLYRVNTYMRFEDNLISKFVPVEIEKATDKEGLYRIVNPFAHLGLPDFETRDPDARGEYYYDYRYSGKDGKNYYLEFGPAAIDGKNYWMPGGIIYISQSRRIDAAYSCRNTYFEELDDEMHRSGKMPCYMGTVSLPGADNFELSIDHTGRVLYAVPQTSHVVCTDLTAARALEMPDVKTCDDEALVATLKQQIGNGNCKSLTPEADGKVNLGLSDDQFTAVYATAYDEAGQERWSGLFRFDGTQLDGAYEVSAQTLKDITRSWCDLVETSSDATMRIWVNPLDRNMMCFDNMFEFAKSGTSNRWKVRDKPTRVWLRFGKHDFALHCNSKGIVAEHDYHDSQPTGLMDMTNEYYPDIHIDFSSGVWYRSYYSEDRIWEMYESGEMSPSGLVRKYGRTVVFEPQSFYFLGHSDGNLKEMVIPYCPPTPDSQQQTINDSGNGQYRVPANATTVRYLLQSQDNIHSPRLKTTSADITFSRFMRDQSIGLQAQVTAVSDGMGLFSIPQQEIGEYKLYLAAYDAGGAVVDAHQGPFNAGDQSVTDIEADAGNAPALYYNLQGQPIDNPVPGTLVIMKKGTRTTKVRY